VNSTTLVSLDQIQSLLTIIGIIASAAGAGLVLWLQTKFVRKPAYYHDREETDVRIKALDERFHKIEMDHALFKAANLQKSMEDIQSDLKTLADAVAGLKESVSTKLHEADKRITVIEKRPRGGGGR
jgi:hypothetical protein